MTSQQFALVLRHLKDGFGPYIKKAELEAFENVIQLFEDAPNEPIKKFSQRIRKAWSTASSHNKPKASKQSHRKKQTIPLDEAKGLYYKIHEESLSLSPEEVVRQYHAISVLKIADIKLLAKEVGITIPSKANKAEINEYLLAPLRDRAIDATRKIDF